MEYKRYTRIENGRIAIPMEIKKIKEIKNGDLVEWIFDKRGSIRINMKEVVMREKGNGMKEVAIEKKGIGIEIE